MADAQQTATPQTTAPEDTSGATGGGGRVETRDEIIRAAIAATDNEAPAEPKPAEAPAPAEPAPKPAEAPAADPVKEASAYAERLAADRKLRERERLLRDREAKIAAAEEAQRLLQENPVEFAKKFGGEQFGKRYVAGVVNDGKPDPIEHTKKLEEKIERLEASLQQREVDKGVNEWRTEARAHASANDKLSLRGFYTDDELEQAASEYAGRHWASQIDEPESRILLKPDETLGKMNAELVDRLTRLSKTPAGQQLLRSLVQAPQPAPPEQRPASAAAAPKTLTSSMDATPAPTRTRSGTLPPSSNDELLREALKAWQ